MDDEEVARTLIRKSFELEFESLEIEEAQNGVEALEKIREMKPHVVLSDINMPEMNGLELLRRVSEEEGHIQFVVFTGREDLGAPISALKLGASDYLRKPLNIEELNLSLKRAFDRWELEHKLEQYTTRLEEMVEERTVDLKRSNDWLKAEMEENRVLEAKLCQAAKLEALGTLAGGITHDFNNILYAITGYADLVLSTLPRDCEPQRNLQEVMNAAHRGQDLVDQILTFSRKTEPRQIPVRLSGVISEVLKMVKCSLPRNVKIIERIEAKEATVLADPTQLQQVVLNLCTNAGHAMGESGGVLEVHLKSLDMDESFVDSRWAFDPGRYLLLSVSDTGCGMTKDVLERVFDPFFTTKAVGEGTGIGLSVVHGIVNDAGGAINIYSEVGKGTTFQVYLPCEDVGAEEEVPEEESSYLGSERVLLVDDEIVLSLLGKKMLERLGYSVTALTSGKEALELFTRAPGDYDVVVLDQVMPGMSGIELADALLKVKEDLLIILCTGFSQMVLEEQAREVGIKAHISKPIVAQALGKVIRQALDESQMKEVDIGYV